MYNKMCSDIQTTKCHIYCIQAFISQTNTFQAVLATDRLQSFVIFLYADGEIQWTTGDASGGSSGLGGTPAQVGFNAGDGIRYAAIPQSRTNEIIGVSSTSNIGVPGVWVFRTDENTVEIAGCDDLYIQVPGPNEENGMTMVYSYVLKSQWYVIYTCILI